MNILKFLRELKFGIRVRSSGLRNNLYITLYKSYYLLNNNITRMSNVANNLNIDLFQM